MRQFRRTPALPAALFEPLEARQMLAVAPTMTGLNVSSSATQLGQNVLLTAAITPTGGTGTPTGLVRFKDGAKILGSVALDATGHAALNVYNLFTGVHNIFARYVGNADFHASSSPGFANPVTVSLPTTTTATDGLQTATITPGTGTGAANGQALQVNYTGYLTDGTRFDSSLNPGRTPFNFILGHKSVIDGWEEGMLGLKAGETRLLIVPPALGYGTAGQGSIPGNATLYFIVRGLGSQNSNTPTLVVTGDNRTPIASGAAASGEAGTNFGAVAVGASSITTTFTIKSGNDGNLSFTQTPGAVLSGVNPRRFTLGTLQSGNGEVSFTVTFNPNALGSRRARVNIFTNDSQFPTFSILLMGTGI